MTTLFVAACIGLLAVTGVAVDIVLDVFAQVWFNRRGK